MQLTLFPVKPRGAIDNSAVPTTGKGIMWKLQGGGWAFQYPDMSARVDKNGRTEIAWGGPRYSVAMDDKGITYHSNETVVHRDVDGGLVYHTPFGTMHQTGDEVVYHWCHPNVIVYQKKDGFVYYDDLGITYRGLHDVAHWSRNGEILYQGAGGITRQRPDGTVTHWTEAGAVYSHADGTVSYVAEGDTEPHQVSSDALGPEQFPGPPLTAKQVLDMVNAAMAASSAAPAPAAAAAAAPSAAPPPGIA